MKVYAFKNNLTLQIIVFLKYKNQPMKEYNIASIPGDGIGKEVVPEGLKVLKDAAEKHQFKINFTEYDFASCDYYEKHGKMLPDDWK